MESKFKFNFYKLSLNFYNKISVEMKNFQTIRFLECPDNKSIWKNIFPRNL